MKVSAEPERTTRTVQVPVDVALLAGIQDGFNRVASGATQKLPRVGEFTDEALVTFKKTFTTAAGDILQHAEEASHIQRTVNLIASTVMQATATSTGTVDNAVRALGEEVQAGLESIRTNVIQEFQDSCQSDVPHPQTALSVRGHRVSHCTRGGRANDFRLTYKDCFLCLDQGLQGFLSTMAAEHDCMR